MHRLSSGFLNNAQPSSNTVIYEYLDIRAHNKFYNLQKKYA